MRTLIALSLLVTTANGAQIPFGALEVNGQDNGVYLQDAVVLDTDDFSVEFDFFSGFGFGATTREVETWEVDNGNLDIDIHRLSTRTTYFATQMEMQGTDTDPRYWLNGPAIHSWFYSINNRYESEGRVQVMMASDWITPGPLEVIPPQTLNVRRPELTINFPDHVGIEIPPVLLTEIDGREIYSPGTTLAVERIVAVLPEPSALLLALIAALALGGRRCTD